MDRVYSKYGFVAQSALAASVVIGFITLATVLLTEPGGPQAAIHLHTDDVGWKLVGDEVAVVVEVEASVPTNVFAGEVLFNNQNLTVKQIDYNTSIADLWAEEPWYSNGDGSVNFAGGTTKAGGFTGKANLLEITFEVLEPGESEITIIDSRVLLHNGLGTDAQLAASEPLVIGGAEPTFSARSVPETKTLHMATEAPSADINGDGKISFADVSGLMARIGSTEARYDINGDGLVGLKDLNIVMSKLGK